VAHRLRRDPPGGGDPWDELAIADTFWAAPVGLGILDRDLRYVWVNDALAWMDGLPVSAHTGRTPAEIIPGIAPQIEPMLRSVLDTVAAVTDGEIHGERPSAPGEQGDWSVSSFPIRAADGSARGVGVMVGDTTERRRAWSALEERERRTRRILDSAPDAVIAIDATGSVIEWNARAEAMFGWTRGEAAGRVLTQLIIPERYREAHREGLRRYLETGEGVIVGERTELSAVRRDGTELPVELTVIPIPGTAPTFSAFVRDVSERRVAESAIQENEDRAEDALRLGDERLRSVIETAPSGIVVVNADGIITLVNHAAEQMFGYPREELVGSSIERLVSANVRGLHEQERSDYLRAPETRLMGVGRHLFAVRSDGSEFPVEVGLAVAQSDEGTLVTAIVTDISERVRSQEELRRSLERLASLSSIDRAILSSRSVNEVMHAALRGLRRIVTCDRAAVSRIDLEADEAIVLALESDLLRSVPDGASTPILGDVSDLRQGGMRLISDLDPFSEEPGIFALAEEGIRSLVVLPMVVEGVLFGMLTLESTRDDAFGPDELDVAREVADQLAIALHQSQLQQQLERHAEELEQRVAERTSELQQINAQLDAFAYSISHDLRAPLRAMEGFSLALLEDFGERLGPEGRDHAERVRRAAARMDQLIRDLLAYSRLSREELTLRPVAMERVVDEAIEQIRPDVEAAGAQITVMRPMPDAIGHPATLVQVLANLLTNACKFVVEGNVAHVRVGAEPRGDVVRLWVQDDGIGIEPQFHSRIFGVMERLHGVDRFSGTGIGLAIVAKGAERMGGVVGLESEAGRGSTFWVDLPAEGRRDDG
jgi:PAS domain S-box-containing protein